MLERDGAEQLLLERLVVDIATACSQARGHDEFAVLCEHEAGAAGPPAPPPPIGQNPEAF